MQVVNKDQNGKEIDLTKVKIPKSSMVYEVLKGIYERNSNESSIHEEQIKEKLRIYPEQ